MDAHQQQSEAEAMAEAEAAADAAEAAEQEEAEQQMADMAEAQHDVPGSPAALSRDLASASSALHGLLAKLGAGLDDLVPGAAMNHGRLKALLAGLRAEGDDSRQLEALMQLCDLLAIASEESLATFALDAFVPALVHLLHAEWQPDVMLLAARALTHLADVLPSACAAIVHYGAVPCFCARLLTIEYIDLAEQSLQVRTQLPLPRVCVRARCLSPFTSPSTGHSRCVQHLKHCFCSCPYSLADSTVMMMRPTLPSLTLPSPSPTHRRWRSCHTSTQRRVCARAGCWRCCRISTSSPRACSGWQWPRPPTCTPRSSIHTR
jgi:E3 ubiquitin-protein ligase TRIP12